jgi:hypothetical protein
LIVNVPLAPTLIISPLGRVTCPLTTGNPLIVAIVENCVGTVIVYGLVVEGCEVKTGLK